MGEASPRRFLVVTLEAAGNWPPILSLIRALTQRGHHVRVVANANQARDIAAAGAVYEAYRHAPQRDSAERPPDMADEMMRVLNDVFFGPLYADELLAAVAREQPDVLLVDQMLIMAWIAAESTSLPTAILWHTVFNGTAGMVNMVNMFIPQMNALRARVGLSPIEPPWTMVRSGVPILAFTYREFDDPSPTTPAEVQYVGPLACLPRAHPSYTLPWPADDRRPLVLVSYSTSYQDQVGTLQRVADAVADIDARVLMTLGHSIAPDELRLPANVAAERFIPHAGVLPHTDLVVTHAGHGTVMAAVTAGVPMVCTPMGRDQHSVAGCVERRGLGRVITMTASANALRDAIVSALTDTELRQRARAFAVRLDLQAGLQRAMSAVEQL